MLVTVTWLAIATEVLRTMIMLSEEENKSCVVIATDIVTWLPTSEVLVAVSTCKLFENAAETASSPVWKSVPYVFSTTEIEMVSASSKVAGDCML